MADLPRRNQTIRTRGPGNGEECVPMLMLNHSETAQETTGRTPPRRTSSSADRNAKPLEMGASSISPASHVSCGSGGGSAADGGSGGSSSAAVNPSSTTANLIQLAGSAGVTERVHRGSATSAASILAIANKIET